MGHGRLVRRAFGGEGGGGGEGNTDMGRVRLMAQC